MQLQKSTKAKLSVYKPILPFKSTYFCIEVNLSSKFHCDTWLTCYRPKWIRHYTWSSLLYRVQNHYPALRHVEEFQDLCKLLRIMNNILFNNLQHRASFQGFLSIQIDALSAPVISLFEYTHELPLIAVHLIFCALQSSGFLLGCCFLKGRCNAYSRGKLLITNRKICTQKWYNDKRDLSNKKMIENSAGRLLNGWRIW